MEPVETIEYKGYVIRIIPDDCGESPRNWDNLGTMLCKHKRYDLGDHKEAEKMSAEEILEYVKRKDVVSLGLYLYDHSGLYLKSSRNGNPWYGRLPQGHAEFDSGLVGWITVTHEKIREEYWVKKITKKVLEKVYRVLEDEVETYADYLSGNVYGYEIVKGEHDPEVCGCEYRGNDAWSCGHIDGEDEVDVLNSCWGYYPEHNLPRGRHELQSMIDECKKIIDTYVERDEELKNIQKNITSA